MRKFLLFIALSTLLCPFAMADSNQIIETKAGEPLFDTCIQPIITGEIYKSNRCFDNEYNPLNATVRAYRYNYLKYEKLLYFIATFEDGYLNGEVIVFKQDGGKNVFNFKDHKLNGTAKLYDNFGRLRGTLEFKNGYLEGNSIYSYENGNKASETSYAKGRQSIMPIFYNMNGELKTGIYKNDGDNLTREHSFFLGNLIQDIYYKENGDIDTQINYNYKGKATSGFCYKETTDSYGKKEIKKIEFNPMHLYKINALGVSRPCKDYERIPYGI